MKAKYQRDLPLSQHKLVCLVLLASYFYSKEPKDDLVSGLHVIYRWNRVLRMRHDCDKQEQGGGGLIMFNNIFNNCVFVVSDTHRIIKGAQRDNNISLSSHFWAGWLNGTKKIKILPKFCQIMS